MKKIILTMAIVVGLSQANNVFSNGNKENSAKSISMTYAQELELLEEYIPEIDTAFLNEALTYQVYGADFELIMEGIGSEYAEIDNIELYNLVNDSDFITRIGNRVIYVLSK